jgi:hypothetical protein
VNADGVAKADLAVDDASNQAADVLENYGTFCRVLVPVLRVLAIERYICGAENGLYDQRDFMRWQIEIDWDREAD